MPIAPSSDLSTRFDLIVVGDEVESIITAVSAARCGLRVAVVRRSKSILGGLSTRGGLNYMDITPEYKSPLFSEFLKKASVKRVALDASQGHQVLQNMLSDSNVTLISGAEAFAHYNELESGWELSFEDSSQTQIQAPILIDATPDADVARQLERPYTVGLGHIFGPTHNFLGVSPVFRMAGLDRHELINFERSLRERLNMFHLLEQALPHHPVALRRELLERPVYSPDDMDYIDILNPIIGIAFHHWRQDQKTKNQKTSRITSYSDAQITIDGFNTARLSDDTLGFNGLVMRINDFDALLAYSQGSPHWPEALTGALNDFCQFLQAEGGFVKAEAIQLILPEELYVRQTLNMHAQEMMTAEKAIRGGVSADDAIGTFSYWLDLRGITFTEFFPNHRPLPKPVFNVGLGVCFPHNPNHSQHLKHFAFVGRSAGYSPIGQGACRIVQHNAMLGEALGICAALAFKSRQALHQIDAQSIRSIIEERSKNPLKLSGHPTWSDEEIATSALIQADNQVLKQLWSKNPLSP